MSTDPESAESIDGANKPDFLAYNSEAKLVLGALQRTAGQTRLEALQSAYTHYCQGAVNPDLRQQAELIIFAIAAHQWEGQLHRTKDREAADSLKNRLISYNHSLSRFIYENPRGVLKEKLESWLAGATGDADWALTMVLGAGGEVVLRRLLAASPRVKAHPGTIEQDRHGIDLIALVDNPQAGPLHYGIDVKVRKTDHHYFGHLQPQGTEIVDGQRLRLVEWTLREDDFGEDFRLKDGVADTQLRELIFAN